MAGVDGDLVFVLPVLTGSRSACRERNGPQPGTGASAEDGGDHVGQMGGVPVERGAVVAFPVQVAIVSEAYRAEPGLGGAGDFDVGGGLERFPVFAHLQGDGQAPVLQASPDRPFDRERPVSGHARNAGFRVGCAEDVDDDRGEGGRAAAGPAAGS